jgi:hypothetical protein
MYEIDSDGVVKGIGELVLAKTGKNAGFTDP